MNSVHLWLGKFNDEDALKSYFQEQHENDDAPLNGFAEDQGVTSYDSDGVESSFLCSGDLKAQLSGHSYSEQYLDDLLEVAQDRELEGMNTFILASADEFPEPVSMTAGDYEIHYLGEFNAADQGS